MALPKPSPSCSTPELIRWLERTLDTIEYGEAGIVFHLRAGQVTHVELILRRTLKIPK